MINIPKSITEYIQFMGGVDKFDQSASYYSFNHKSKRWYMKLFFHFLEIAIHNSYIMYKNSMIQK